MTDAILSFFLDLNCALSMSMAHISTPHLVVPTQYDDETKDGYVNSKSTLTQQQHGELQNYCERLVLNKLGKPEMEQFGDLEVHHK